MEPIFNIGDIVIVKNRERNELDYKFAFTDEMAKLSGKIFTIENVQVDREFGIYRVPDDNALYKLKGDTFNWSSGMLMKADEYSLKSHENVTKTLKIKMKIENAVYSSLRKQGIKI